MYPVVYMDKNPRPRGDRVGIAREQWRVWASSAFDSLPRGAKAQCAKELGFGQGVINKVLDGETGTSSKIPMITRWLEEQGIENPFRRADMVLSDLLNATDQNVLWRWIELGEDLIKK